MIRKLNAFLRTRWRRVNRDDATVSQRGPDPGGVTACSPGVADPGIQRANWNFEARELASDNTIPTGSDLLIISFSDRNFQEHPGRAKSHVNG